MRKSGQKCPQVPTPPLGLAVTVTTIPVFLSITEYQAHLGTGSQPLPLCHTNLLIHFHWFINMLENLLSLQNEPKQNILLWFYNFLISQLHSKISGVAATGFFTLTCHSLLRTAREAVGCQCRGGPCALRVWALTGPLPLSQSTAHLTVGLSLFYSFFCAQPLSVGYIKAPSWALFLLSSLPGKSCPAHSSNTVYRLLTIKTLTCLSNCLLDLSTANIITISNQTVHTKILILLWTYSHSSLSQLNKWYPYPANLLN